MSMYNQNQASLQCSVSLWHCRKLLIHIVEYINKLVCRNFMYYSSQFFLVIIWLDSFINKDILFFIILCTNYICIGIWLLFARVQHSSRVNLWGYYHASQNQCSRFNQKFGGVWIDMEKLDMYCIYVIQGFIQMQRVKNQLKKVQCFILETQVQNYVIVFNSMSVLVQFLLS